jgi:hypothetical protein
MKSLFAASTLAATLLAGTALATTPSSCNLGNGIKHVVYLQFDNTHFARDNANVPSDLEQMPHLLSFIKQNGVLLTNDHTQLISHTSDGIITSETGVYPDRHGAAAIANSFNFYNSVTENAPYTSSSFIYWTDKLNEDTSATGADTSYVLLDELGQNTPAPWVAYTRAGCDVAALGIADIDMENATTDLATVYGPTSAEYLLGSSSSYSKQDQASADFEGIALHCAIGSPICAAANALSGTTNTDGFPLSKAVTDALPQEPGGYTGYQGIFGHRYLLPAVQSVLGQATNGQLYDYQGNLIGYQTASGGVINQSKTISGFPGFGGMFPFVTLSYAEEMLKAGVPVVYGYFTDAHDHSYGTQDGVNAAGSSFAYGPGEQGYVNQLKQYDAAWQTFFTNLTADGITPTNTLFVILVEEGDKFAGGKPLPAGCNGVTTPCTYPANVNTNTRPDKGEVDINIDQLLSSERGDTIPFYVHADMAPAFYLNGNPAPTSTTMRTLQKDLAALTYADPYYFNTKTLTVPVEVGFADQADLAALHMITADPQRTPSFVAFNNDDVYSGIGAVTSGSSNPTCAGQSVCTYQGYAWNHGGIAAVVRQTWSSMVGPGVNNTGTDPNTWADHTDMRATMFALLGLKDDYLHDGRVLLENLNTAALPATISSHPAAYKQLAVAYKQLTAPFGTANTAGIRYATAAIESTSTNDATYITYVSTMNAWVASRNALLAQIKTLLNNAETGTSFDISRVPSLVSQANALTNQMVALGGSAAH